MKETFYLSNSEIAQAFLDYLVRSRRRAKIFETASVDVCWKFQDVEGDKMMGVVNLESKGY